MIPNSMRTKQSEQAYQIAKENKTLKPLYKEPALERWDDWILIENRFPYDLVFKTHHILVPTRDFKNRSDMMLTERRSLEDLLNYLQHGYDIMFENTHKSRSIKDLFHIHLACWKDRSEVERLGEHLDG